MKRSPVSFKTIKQAVERVTRTLHPEKVILFGSYAYGKPSPDSDVDLLLIFKEKKKSCDYWYSEVSQLLEPRSFPVDILIRTPAQIQQRLKIGDTFIQEILGRGKVLYES